ncbi:phosphotransferase family protein [Microbacterium sp. MYb64]|uniref:phosphotransferase family protein n=1 Tax=Microbacterium sp. MYb64 TaxID=1848691 RepID=UPI000CFDBEE6|nr:phosphotransferase family protein [Microbacterium sp. MYb64]PRB07528.1 acyl-CoA dehydrogenase [Microbacterium sp. MYb64]
MSTRVEGWDEQGTPGLDVAGLTSWLAETHPELMHRPLSATIIAGGKSNLTYAIDGAHIPLVLRRPPLGHVLSSAHDMRREHRVLSALADSAVPVPRVIDVDDDRVRERVTGTIFLLMERVPGQVLTTSAQNAPYSAGGLRALSLDLAHRLADLHAIDPESVGLGGFGRPEGYLVRQLSTWQRQLESSRSRSTPALDELQLALSRGLPAASRAGIVHGDYRLDNALVVDDGDVPRISAILDWEMATLGDPLVDLGMLAVYWDIGRMPGGVADVVPSAVDPRVGYLLFDEVADAYAEQTRMPLPDLRWYRAFGAYKLAVILEGIHFRFRTGGTVGAGFDQVGAIVEPIARHGLEEY